MASCISLSDHQPLQNLSFPPLTVRSDYKTTAVPLSTTSESDHLLADHVVNPSKQTPKRCKIVITYRLKTNLVDSSKKTNDGAKEMNGGATDSTPTSVDTVLAKNINGSEPLPTPTVATSNRTSSSTPKVHPLPEKKINKTQAAQLKVATPTFHHDDNPKVPDTAAPAKKKENNKKISDDKKKRAVFSVTLSKEEIEEDFVKIEQNMAKMEGLKRSKRLRRAPNKDDEGSKKRSAIVQRQLDRLFPGLGYL